METYKRKLMKRCISLLATELAKDLIYELEKEPSISEGPTPSIRKRLLKPSKKKRSWVKNSTDRQYYIDGFFELPQEIFSSDPSLSFLKRVGIEHEQFMWLLAQISPFIQKQDTIMRDALPAHVKLKIVLGYLIMGGSYQYLSNQFQIPKNSISSFLSDVMSAICNALEEFMKVPSTDKEWRSIEKEFNKKYNFPNCCGSLDGKCLQIMSRKPPVNIDLPNPKHNFYFVILVALVDAQHCFTYIDIKTTIRNKQDEQNFENTQLEEMLKRNDFNLPNNAVIVANNPFPLMDNIMTPYSCEKGLTEEQIKYNNHVQPLLRLNDNTFKVLCTKFRVFDKAINVGVDKIPILVKSCCSLHNWLIKTNPSNSQQEILDKWDLYSWQQAYSTGGAFQSINKICMIKSSTAIEKQNWYISYFNKEDVTPNDTVSSDTDIKMETDT